MQTTMKPIQKSGAMEMIVAAMPLVTIALVLYSIYFVFQASERHERLILLTDRIALNVSESHRALEEGIIGDEAISVERDVYAPLDEALLVARAMRRGGQTRLGAVEAVPDPALRRTLGEIEAGLHTLRQMSTARWNNPASSQPGSDGDRAYDAVLDEVMALTEASVDARDAYLDRDYTWMLGVGGGITLLLAFLFGGMITVEFGKRRSLAAKEAEAAQERKLLRTLIDNVPDYMYVKDTESRFILANQATAAVMGATAEELAGKTDADFFPSTLAEQYRADEARVVQSGEAMLNHEEVVLDPQGNHRWLLTTKAPVYNGEGQVVGLVGIGRDVSERKKTNEERARLASIVESSDDAILSKTLDGIITSWNKGAERLFGYSAGEIVGRPATLLTSPDRPNEEPEILAKIARGEHIHHYETVRVTKDGRAVNVSLTISPLRDALGQITGASSIARDITRRKAAEAKLREREAHYRSLIETSPDAITLLDLEANIILCNEQAALMNGYEGIEAMIGQNGFECVALEDRERALGTLSRIFTEGVVRDVQYNVLRQDGSRLPIEANASLVVGPDGKPTAILTIARDISERRRAEEALRQQNEVLATLHETSLGMMNRLEGGELLEAIIARAAQLLGAANGFIYLVETEEEMEVKAGVGAISHYIGYRLKKGVGLNGKVWETGQPLVVNDYDEWAGHLPGFDQHIMHAAIGVPLHYGGEILGVIGLSHAEPHLQFGSEELDRLTQFAQLAAIALDNAQLYSSAQQELRERRQMEEALRQSEEQFRSLVETTTEWIWAMDEESRFTYSNPAVTAILGYTPEELVGKTALDLMHEEDRRTMQAIFPKLVAARRGWNGLVVRFRHKDGGYRYLESNSTPIRGADGRVVGFRGADRDVTARRRSEAALREANERFQVVARATNDAVWDWNLETDHLWWNEGIQILFGYPAAEVQQDIHWWSNLIHPEDVERVEASLQSLMESGEQMWSNEYRLRRYDGSYAYVLDRGYVIHDEHGKAVRMIGSLLDLTERKEVETELQRAKEAAEAGNHAKSEFLANMSHEIRTPMNGVIGMAGLLLDTNLDPEQRKYAETVRLSAERLLTIINDILDFSKIEAGKLDLETNAFEVRAVVEEVADLFAETAQVKGLELASRVEHEVPAMLRGDPGRLRQVLLNLVGNAVKFTEVGEVVLRCGLVNVSGGHAVIRFEVSDTGIGITEAECERLFKPFMQADSSTTRQYGGTGLGLAISKQLVALMDGEIGVMSKKNQGSIFWFTVPLETVVDLQPSLQAHLSPIQLPGLRVLVVDDNATNREILHHQVTGWGMRNGSAGDAPYALEMLRAAATRGEPYDMAILDMQMPEMDGLELARRIKADPTLAPTRLVMLSSVAQRGMAREAAKAEIAAYLTKPVRQAELYNCLVQVMNDQGEGILAPPSSQPSAQPAPVQGHIRLLVAEDNAVNQTVAERMLEKRGYRVDVVSNGLEALEALAQIPYAAVLMDCQMPEMDGYEATMEIRRYEGTERRTPIIAMTAHAMQGDREKCLAAGMDDYLTKPVRAEELEAVLARWVPRPAVERSEAPPAGGASEPPEEPLDQSVLDGLRELTGEGEPDILIELVDIFLSDAAERMVLLRDAIARGDANTLERVAHSLKGSSANFGARRMSRLCLELEQVGKQGDIMLAPELFARLELEWQRVGVALRAELLESAA